MNALSTSEIERDPTCAAFGKLDDGTVIPLSVDHMALAEAEREMRAAMRKMLSVANSMTVSRRFHEMLPAVQDEMGAI